MKMDIKFKRLTDENGENAYEIVDNDIYCPVQTRGPVTGFHRLLAVNLRAAGYGVMEVSDLNGGEVCVIMNRDRIGDMFKFTELVKDTLKEFYKSIGKRVRRDVRLDIPNVIHQYENLLGQKAWTALVFLLIGAPRVKVNYDTDTVIGIV